MDATFNASRLRLARRRRAMSKVQLAQAVDVSVRRITQLENEGKAPSEALLLAIAAVLDFPCDFFFRPDPPQPTSDGVSFRSASRLSSGRRVAALEAAAIGVELDEWIRARFDLPAPDVPDLRDVGVQAARGAALALRQMWALGNDPAPNMIHLLEAHGVRVFSLTDDSRDLDAYSFWYDARPFVFLTRHKSPERQRWDAAHELGHLVLHLETPPSTAAHEVEADEFASTFLLPPDGFGASAPWHPTLADVRRHKLVWKVSALAYIRALKAHGHVTEWEYRNLVIEASQAGLRSAEGDINRETSQVADKVLGALRSEGVGVREIARDLSVHPAEVRGLLFSSMTVLSGDQDPDDAPRAHLKALR